MDEQNLIIRYKKLLESTKKAQQKYRQKNDAPLKAPLALSSRLNLLSNFAPIISL